MRPYLVCLTILGGLYRPGEFNDPRAAAFLLAAKELRAPDWPASRPPGERAAG